MKAILSVSPRPTTQNHQLSTTCSGALRLSGLLLVGMQVLLRPQVKLIELLLIAVLAVKASQLQLTVVLLLPVAVGLILVFLRWPPLGLIIAGPVSDALGVQFWWLLTGLTITAMGVLGLLIPSVVNIESQAAEHMMSALARKGAADAGSIATPSKLPG